ncbi:hypothetical protein VTJ49DRAFT_2611 [Mycothermus thermophilus]|uniref:Exo-alpha-sialidase n=1 Tax=Humicola insolens TaxID=85995 RepID=A0ABR3V9V6_HUMIN
MVYRSTDRGKTWTEPDVVFDLPELWRQTGRINEVVGVAETKDYGTGQRAVVMPMHTERVDSAGHVMREMVTDRLRVDNLQVTGTGSENKGHVVAVYDVSDDNARGAALWHRETQIEAVLIHLQNARFSLQRPVTVHSMDSQTPAIEYLGDGKWMVVYSLLHPECIEARIEGRIVEYVGRQSDEE